MTKILVSMVAYREKNLEASVRSCWERADNPEDLLFSIVSEASSENLHADLSFIPEEQILYRKYDLSEYRGVLWSRAKTMETDFEYDLALITCGHNLFATSWDTISKNALMRAQAKTKDGKAVVTFCAPEYTYNEDGSYNLGTLMDGIYENKYHRQFSEEYFPGHGFPAVVPVSKEEDVVEGVYYQASWVFADKQFFKDVPLEEDINYHAEEIYLSVKSWCAGYRFFATHKLIYIHDTGKKYPGEDKPRFATHRPWLDMNRDAFWKQSDESMIKLNNLLSGNLEVPLEKILEYAEFSGLNKKWCKKIEEIHLKDLELGERHMFWVKDGLPEPVIVNY